jgi:hypothetical protein
VKALREAPGVQRDGLPAVLLCGGDDEVCLVEHGWHELLR